ncbi:MAG: hypothetical protein GX227_01615 [Clostridiaceae bacterium]|jgi:flagellar hook-length control protein FliK|nr:hypothetical protein [Clostridiaceae bacterium]
MQNSVISAEFSVPMFMGALQKNTTHGIPLNDDTFMNMLSERIAARNNRTVSAQRNEPVKTRASTIKDETREIQNTKNDAEAKTSGSKAVENEEIKVSGEVERTAAKEDKSKKELEEEINTLEAMILLLEELMARLETIDTPTDRDFTGTEPEAAISPESQSVSPMELLMALVEGNIEKLKKLANELNEGINSPEVNELVEKIRSLIERLSGNEEKEIVLDLTAEVEKAKEPAHAEIIKDLKAKCGQLIQKLKEQVSKLRETLPKDPEEHTIESTVLKGPHQEPVKDGIDENESKSQTDSRDSKAKAEVSEQSPDSPVINKDNGEDFEKFVIPNNQTAAETVKGSPHIGKTPIILSGRPLEQTITNQVMMKVKLMAGENKQEMEMQLKPDSLGKLSLKIIHERGEILARITAENEQVKGILESNMQLLKDALEKNGFSVQSLSVSVGNDHGENRTKEESGPGGKNIAGTASRNEMKSAISDIPDLRAKIEREYYAQSSKINLTA